MKNIILVIGLLFVSAAVAHAGNLSGKEVSALISGKTGHWHTADGKISGTMQWKANGQQQVTGNFKGFSSDEGKWRVKGNSMCSTWSKIRGGKEKCDPVKDMGGGQYQTGNSIFTVD